VILPLTLASDHGGAPSFRPTAFVQGAEPPRVHQQAPSPRLSTGCALPRSKKRRRLPGCPAARLPSARLPVCPAARLPGCGGRRPLAGWLAEAML